MFLRCGVPYGYMASAFWNSYLALLFPFLPLRSLGSTRNIIFLFCALTVTVNSSLQTFQPLWLCFHSLNQCYSFPHQLKKIVLVSDVERMGKGMVKIKRIFYMWENNVLRTVEVLRRRCWGNRTKNKSPNAEIPSVEVTEKENTFIIE